MLEPFTRRGLLRRRHPDRALSVFRRSLGFSASPRLPAHIPEGQNIMIDWVPQSRLVSEHKNAAQTARNDSVLQPRIFIRFSERLRRPLRGPTPPAATCCRAVPGRGTTLPTVKGGG